MSKLQDRVVLVGVGGATCSGKTTLAKHLRSILANSIIIHQDDFAPPEELIPIHPVHNIADWDAPKGAIDWPRLRLFLKSLKENGVIPPDHRSHDHMNEQKDIPITHSVYQELTTRFQEIEDEQRKKGIRIIWGLVDGFLLYWDKEIIDQLDVRFFLRVPHDVLKQRRHERHGYHTAGRNMLCWGCNLLMLSDRLFPPSSPIPRVQPPLTSDMASTYLHFESLCPHSLGTHPRVCPREHSFTAGVQFNPEGSLWRDPPMYWEHIVYPAYIEAHGDIFEDGDVENGKLTGERVPGLVVIEPVKKGAELSIDDIVRSCCDVLWNFAHALDA